MRTVEWPGYVFKGIDAEPFPYHPLLRAMTETPPEGYKFREEALPYCEYNVATMLRNLDTPNTWGVHERWRRFLLAWRENCRGLGVSDEDFLRPIIGQTAFPHFTATLNHLLTVPPDVPCAISPCLVPVPNDWMIEVEDWCTAFYWYLVNGHTAGIDLRNHTGAKVIRALFMLDNFKGVFTHVRQTIDSLSAILGQDLRHKFFYVPLGVEQPDISSRRRSDKIRFLFHGSFNHSTEHFFLRGGFYFLEAFRRIEAKYPNIEFAVIYSEQGMQTLHPAYRELLRSHPKIQHINWYVSHEEMQAELLKADVLVLPAYRAHCMTMAKALSHGLPVLASNGWGISDFIKDGFNGLIADFSPRTNSWVDELGIFREEYAPLNSLDETIVKNLMEKIGILAENPRMIDFMSRNAVDYARSNLTIENRNCYLKNVFDYVFP